MDPLASHTDAELVGAALDQHPEAFDQLVLRYQGPLARVARSRLGRIDWAEDVVQETFLAAYSGLASFDRRLNFRTWLWTILLNNCHRHYQRRARRVTLESWSSECEAAASQSDDEQASSPIARLLARERAEQLEELLAELSDAQSDALRLRFFGGLKFQEIADAMQCSLNTAKNRVRQGLLGLTDLIRERETIARRQHELQWEQPNDELRPGI